MSTRALIGIEVDDGIRYIYCHSDGYLSHLGKVLTENYNTAPVINELMDYGNAGSIGETFKECFFYGGDYEKAMMCKDRKGFLLIDMWIEYWYLFSDGKWLYSRGDEWKDVPPVEQEQDVSNLEDEVAL